MGNYNDIAGTQLRKLCRSLDLDGEYEKFLELQRFLFAGWGEREVPKRVAYPSLIGDDHSPYEYSVAFAPGAVELRLLLEAQADPPSLVGNHREALTLTRRLATRYGASLRRFDLVSDLLCPPDPQGAFSLWHAAGLVAGKRPEFKVYFNPQVRGPAQARPLMIEVLERLGLAAAAKLLFEHAPLGERDELKYFSLDLADGERARVKVYFYHHDATAAALERAFAIAPSHQRGDVRAFLAAVAGREGPFTSKPPSSCFAFTAGQSAPTAATLHFPIAHYLGSDEEVVARVSGFLQTAGLPAQQYRSLMSNITPRPLGAGPGLQSYASYRRERAGLRFTAYLSPLLFAEVQRPRMAAAR